MSFSVSFRLALSSLNLDVAFASEGRLVALFGPSGCGKTTAVNAIAGLIRPASAKIVVGGTVLSDTLAGVWTPPHRRRIGYVFQDARLLPHLSVRRNLLYGQWFTPSEMRYADEAGVVALLGLAPFLERKPNQLSGGEKQRVALGRALLQSPKLLLMDEPLASLDDARKQEVLPYIERLRDETRIPIVYVSHSAAEVARLATDIVLMADGRVAASGPAAEIMPLLSGGGAELAPDAGSLIDMTVKRFDAASGLTILASPAGEARISGRIAAEGAVMRIYIKATDVLIATERPKSISALNIFRGTVSAVADEKASAGVTLRCGDAEIAARITRFSARRLGLKPGAQAYAIVKAMSVKPPAARPAAGAAAS
jgi:molybdate transport system ATP-binding protein